MVAVLDGEHDPVPELIVQSIPFIIACQPRFYDQLILISLAFQIFDKIIAGHVCKAQPEMLNGFLAKLSFVEVGISSLPCLASKLIIKISGGFLIHLQKSCPLGIPLSGFLPLLKIGKGNACPFCQKLYRFLKGGILILHHKRKHIASCPTAKAVKHLLAGRDRKGRGFFIVKGTKPKIAASLFLYFYIT